MPLPLRPGYLSPNFSLVELTFSQIAVRLALDNTPDPQVLANLRRLANEGLEPLRALLGNVPVLPSSGYRSLLVNRAAGSDDTSAHRLGLACDFTAPRFGTPLEICRLLAAQKSLVFDQLIFEGTWVHFALAAEGVKPRREVRHAIFKPGQKTTYPLGLPT